MPNLTDELKTKLLQAGSVGEMTELLEDAGVDESMAEQLLEELTQKREGDVEELSLDELESVSGGSDRDWLVDGCAATVEPGSWCGSNDACVIWDVTYDHQPREYCTCGGVMYYTWGTTQFKCIACGKEVDISDEHSRPIGQGRKGFPRRTPRGKRH